LVNNQVFCCAFLDIFEKKAAITSIDVVGGVSMMMVN
jgi:hypothetical protein